MRKIALTFGALMAALSLSASPLTPAEALSRLSGTANAAAHAPGANSASMTLRSTVMTPDNASAAIYLFSRENGNRAASSNLQVSNSTLYFLSADDQAEPVLGYIDIPAGMDVTKMDAFPPQLQWWLSEYAKQIAAVQRAKPSSARANESNPDAPQPVLAQRANRSTIAPLCTTKWDQGEPFNNMTPTVNGTHCVTGCTATAMAQVMKYWNYPVNGQGTLSYSVNGTNESKGQGSLPTGTLTIDFSTLNLDWNNMLDIYSGSYTTTQSNAVAKLMKTAGYCARMGYGTSASGASAYTGIANMQTYLNYNENMRGLSRDNFGVLAWEDMLYENLATVGPVLYTGFGINAGGHAFVCDGYYNGLFHFNWGWGGSCDGWFATTALLPGGEGIGGNGVGDYSFSQDAFINITKPDHETITVNASFHNLAGNLIGAISNREGYLNLKTPKTIFAANNDSQTHTFRYWGKFVGEDGSENWGSWYYAASELPPGYGFPDVDIYIPTSLEDGSYYVYPYYTLDGGSEKYPVGASLGTVNYCKLTISNNGSSYSVENFDALEFDVTNLTAISTLYLQSPFRVSYTVSNNSGEELAAGLRPVLYTKNGSSSAAQRATAASDVTIIATGEYRLHDLLPGQSETKEQDSSMSTTLSSAPSKQVYLGLQSEKSGKISGETPVTVKAAVSGSPEIQTVTFKFNGNASAASNVNMTFSGSVKCTSGYYVGPVKVYIFPNSGGYSLAGFNSNTMYLETNQTGYYEATGTFSGAVKGTTYWVVPFSSSGKQLGNGVKVTISEIGTDIVEVKATEISLDKTTASLKEGESLQLAANIIPDNATNQTVEWSSSKDAVATVDQNGKVTAVAKGTAIITAKTTDGTNLSATCNVDVVKLVSGITLDANEMTLAEGQSATITATVTPETASNKTLVWSSSNEDVATVDQDGKVTAVSKGSATITAASTDGSEISASCTVNVVKLVSGITLSETEMTLTEDQSATLVATVTPEAANNKTLAWSSSNEDVATVDQDGKVTAIAKGTATITATSTDGSEISTSCTVNVVKLVSGITLSETEMTLTEGQSATITATVTPEAANIKTLVWSSSNEDVATVDQDGKVTAIAKGTATITAASTDGSEISASCTVNVVKLVSDIVLNETELTINEGETAQLTATVSPAIANNTTVVWASSDETVATVDQNGLVTAIGQGTAEITATSTDGSDISASCNVTVIKLVTSIYISLTEVTLKEGEQTTITAYALPTDATNPIITWYSEDESVATVEEGVVTAIQEGTTYVVVKTTDASNIEEKCKILVDKSSGIGAVGASDLTICVSDGTIVIANAPVDEYVYIFQADGTLAKKEQANGQLITYQPCASGVYLVVVGSHGYKVIVR